MYPIEMQEVPQEFGECWKAAGLHLHAQVQGGIRSWLKASLAPPFLEHLSFRLGNQLFFVRIEDEDGLLTVPGNRSGLLHIADACRGFACLMPMRRRAGAWSAGAPGWGLVDLQSGRPLDPPARVTDEKIEMTDWEIQDFAVQVIGDHVVSKGFQLMSSQGNPAVDPSIWFVGPAGAEWIVVRAVRYPSERAEPPSSWRAIALSCARLGKTGHFASVGIASANQDDADSAAPLWRGHPMVVRFTGLEPPPG